MEIFDEYSGQIYRVPPEEEAVVLQLQARGATVPEIIDALMLPAPEPEEERVHAYVPANDGTAMPIEEVPELNE
jgi:hypothetical protein